MQNDNSCGKNSRLLTPILDRGTACSYNTVTSESPAGAGIGYGGQANHESPITNHGKKFRYPD